MDTYAQLNLEQFVNCTNHSLEFSNRTGRCPVNYYQAREGALLQGFAGKHGFADLRTHNRLAIQTTSVRSRWQLLS